MLEMNDSRLKLIIHAHEKAPEGAPAVQAWTSNFVPHFPSQEIYYP